MRREQIEERVELSDIIDYAMRDWDNYIDECREEEIPPIDTFEDWIADAVLGNGYRKQEWISVDERLPETNKKVLVCYSNGSMDIAKYIRVDGYNLDFWFEETNFTKTITHWMPLPEAPKKGGAE